MSSERSECGDGRRARLGDETGQMENRVKLLWGDCRGEEEDDEFEIQEHAW